MPEDSLTILSEAYLMSFPPLYVASLTMLSDGPHVFFATQPLQPCLEILFFCLEAAGAVAVPYCLGRQLVTFKPMTWDHHKHFGMVVVLPTHSSSCPSVLSYFLGVDSMLWLQPPSFLAPGTTELPTSGWDFQRQMDWFLRAFGTDSLVKDSSSPNVLRLGMRHEPHVEPWAFQRHQLVWTSWRPQINLQKWLSTWPCGHGRIQAWSILISIFSFGLSLQLDILPLLFQICLELCKLSCRGRGNTFRSAVGSLSKNSHKLQTQWPKAACPPALASEKRHPTKAKLQKDAGV